MRHQLDLIGNAIDSLNEGLRQYEAGQKGDLRAYKFAVLNVSHFIELLLKHAVAQISGLLIYKNPASKNLLRESTIGLWESLQILRNSGHVFDRELVEDLEWLKTLRNSIEHYAFEMDVKDVRSALGRIIRSANDFSATTRLAPLAGQLDPERIKVFCDLLDEYLERLANAKSDASSEVRANEQLELVRCALCGADAVAVKDNDEIRCYFCGEKERIRECSLCFELYRDSETSIWNEDNPDDVAYACHNCEAHIFGGD